MDPNLNIVIDKRLITQKQALLIDKSMIFKVETLEESPFIEPKIPHLPGEKMVYITLIK